MKAASAKQRNIELPKGDIFSETAAKAVKGKAGAARKPGAASSSEYDRLSSATAL